MKKLVLLGALSVLLTGCADNGPAQEPDSPAEDGNALEQNTVNTPPENNSEAEEQASEGTAPENDMNEYEEYNTIAGVQDVSNYKEIVETDNPNKRVILFEDEHGKKVLKSVFVKKQNRLKVISLDDDGLLYNDIIQ